ncbi:MAG: histidine phosphatase family protein [Firmicutes bacterium]|nr:histidine phosphatase family protein [Bacillota bacterium]
MIYFIRHGQTDWNKAGRLQGRTNNPLNETGIKQVTNTRESLEKLGVKFDLCFSSPLVRAVQTAKGVYDGEVFLDNRLLERDFGDAEGATGTWAQYMDFYTPPNDRKTYNSESVEEFQARIYSFYEEIKKKHADRTVLVVAHGGVAFISRGYFKKDFNGDHSHFPDMQNGEILIFDTV